MESMTITPDLQTRESVMVAAGRAQFGVKDGAGNVCYVKIECKRRSNDGRGYERGTVLLEDATHVFISEKGYGTPRLGTYYPPKPGYNTGRFFPADGVDLTHHMDALEAVVAIVNGDTPPLSDLEVRVESKCGLCGQPLTDPISIERGIGPDCAGKPTGAKILHASRFGAPKAAVQAAQQIATTPSGAAPAGPSRSGVTTDQLVVVADAIKGASDTMLESIIAVARREQEKREFAKREAEQERQAALAGI